MSWLVLLYFPGACLVIGWVGAWVLRCRPDLYSRRLHLCRWLLLASPYILLVFSLAKPIGPQAWVQATQPLPCRGIILAMLAILILSRWLGEMAARRALMKMEQGLEMAREADPDLLKVLDLQGLWRRLALPAWRVQAPPPRVLVSKVANVAHLSGTRRPRICLEASLVPRKFRIRDGWWTSVQPPPRIRVDQLRAVIAHELGHYKWLDSHRKMVTVFIGMYLPWEWLFGPVPLKKFHITRTWLFRKWSSLMVWVGRPFRRWVMEDQAISEALADAQAAQLVPEAERHLRTIRALYPGGTEPSSGQHNHHVGFPPWLRQMILVCVMATLVAAAPGRMAYRLTFGPGAQATPLPQSWFLLQAPGTKASAVFLPGGDSVGTIIIRCGDPNPGRPPILRCLGRLPRRCLPDRCRIEMHWDALYKGPGQLTGNEVSLSLTQSALSTRANLDPVTVYSRSQGYPQAAGRWRRFRSITMVKEPLDFEFLMIMFTLAHPGKYTIKPPVLVVVLPSGERRLFTSYLAGGSSSFALSDCSLMKSPGEELGREPNGCFPHSMVDGRSTRQASDQPL